MASLTNLLREVIDEYVLIEIGDESSEPYPYLEITPTHYRFTINIEDQKIEVDVNFEDFDEFEFSFKQSKIPKRFLYADKIFNVAYKVGDSQFQFEKSTAKILLRTLSTVSKIIKEFINKNHPNLLFLFATGKLGSGDNQQKHKIYDAFLWKQISTIPKYNAEDRSGGFIIYNTEFKRT